MPSLKKLEQLKKYPYTIRLGENDGLYFYAISFPDFPDVEAAGETPEEALSMGLDALEAMVDYLEEKGESIPAPTVSPIAENASGRITLRMPKSLHRKLIDRSSEEGVSLNTCVITALAEYLANGKAKKK